MSTNEYFFLSKFLVISVIRMIHSWLSKRAVGSFTESWEDLFYYGDQYQKNSGSTHFRNSVASNLRWDVLHYYLGLVGLKKTASILDWKAFLATSRKFEARTQESFFVFFDKRISRNKQTNKHTMMLVAYIDKRRISVNLEIRNILFGPQCALGFIVSVK